MIQNMKTRAEENQRINDCLLASAANKKEVWIYWSPPIWPWCKLNLDGSCNKSGFSSAGGIIRDHNSKWIQDFG